MTETTSTIAQGESSDLIRVWAESLSHVLGQIGGTPVPCVPADETPAASAPPGEGDLWMVCTSAGALRGEMSLRLSPAATLRIAQTFMGEPAQAEAELTAEYREAVVEFFRQVAGIAASSIKARWGEVQLRLDSAPGSASWPSSATAFLQAGEDAAAILVEMHLSAALVATLKADAAKTDAAETSRVSASSATASLPSGVSTPTSGNGAGLELLMDVELAMTLRFGGRRLLLRDVLELNPGTVIELDRQVQDPVDVLLDGRLLARGEVVVIDGNYGLRVTEVDPAAAAAARTN
jgi:flagellar motor switch protein FliN/FliY